MGFLLPLVLIVNNYKHTIRRKNGMRFWVGGVVVYSMFDDHCGGGGELEDFLMTHIATL